MRSSNPAMNESAMDRIRQQASLATAGGAAADARFGAGLDQRGLDLETTGGPKEAALHMTVGGTAVKSLITLAIVVAGAGLTWGAYMKGVQSGETAGWLFPAMIGGAIGGLIFAIATAFKPHWAPFTTPIYGLLQGLFLGGISAMYQNSFTPESGLNGIVAQAVLLTMGTAGGMFILYAARIIRVTDKLRAGILIATMGVLLAYVASFVMSLFGATMPYLHDSGPIGIGISLVIVAVAAFNLLLDFDFIERGTAMRLPKWAEWYGAFGLMVTLIWLYLEMLRLLAKLKNR
ncbi:MAG: Bax inhibitor-1/YccA family protein [Planctomycetota bacterium]